MKKKGFITLTMIIVAIVAVIVLVAASSFFLWILKLYVPYLLGAAIMIIALLGAVGVFGIKLDKKTTMYALIVGVVIFILPLLLDKFRIPLSVIVG